MPTNHTTDHRLPSSGITGSARRRALTLIELMVVIVILVTLVGGVLPILSPNNDARKIDAASRSLKTFMQKAQTRAGRTGRPVGVMFRESSPGSGVALEAYQVEIPRPFTGFDSQSRARFKDETQGNEAYTYTIQFGRIENNGQFSIVADPPAIPPRMVRLGDTLQIGSARFELSQSNNGFDRDPNTGEVYFKPTSVFASSPLVSGPAPPTVPVDASGVSFPKSYSIARQPVPTSEAPLVLPAGTAIDLHASAIEGGATATLFAAARDTSTVKQIGIMYSPEGGIDSVYYNGVQVGEAELENPRRLVKPTVLAGKPIRDATNVVLLLSQMELGGAELFEDLSRQTQRWNIEQQDSDDQLEEARQSVSWLNPNSKWLVVGGKTGRARIGPMATFDPREEDFNRTKVGLLALDQMRAARLSKDNDGGVAGVDPQ